jgi:hypothetical protein
MACQDIDEFIVPTKADNWQAMLSDINAKVSKQIASYSFRNRFFPTQLPDDAQYVKTADPLVRKYGLRTLLKTQADPSLWRWTMRSKVLARPELLILWHVHLILDSSIVRRGFINFYVTDTDGVLHHYRYTGGAANTINVTRLRYFQSKIISQFKHINNQTSTGA